MDIRSRIRQVLDEKRHLTVAGVSQSAGMSNSALGKFLNPDGPGGIKSLTLDKIEGLARALSVTASWLAFGVGEPQADPRLVEVWSQIPDRDQERALAILRTFVETSPKAAPTQDNAPVTLRTKTQTFEDMPGMRLSFITLADDDAEPARLVAEPKTEFRGADHPLRDSITPAPNPTDKDKDK